MYSNSAYKIVARTLTLGFAPITFIHTDAYNIYRRIYTVNTRYNVLMHLYITSLSLTGFHLTLSTVSGGEEHWSRY